MIDLPLRAERRVLAPVQRCVVGYSNANLAELHRAFQVMSVTARFRKSGQEQSNEKHDNALNHQ
jgi:uncharacterized protein YcbX